MPLPDWVWAVRLYQSRGSAAQSEALAGLALLLPGAYATELALQHRLQGGYIPRLIWHKQRNYYYYYLQFKVCAAVAA